MYLTDSSGNNVYYLSISPNSTTSVDQIITKLVPLTHPTGYVTPATPAFTGYPVTTSRPPYIEILSNHRTYYGTHVFIVPFIGSQSSGTCVCGWV
jgi:hypothetical protein